MEIPEIEVPKWWVEPYNPETDEAPEGDPTDCVGAGEVDE